MSTATYASDDANKLLWTFIDPPQTAPTQESEASDSEKEKLTLPHIEADVVKALTESMMAAKLVDYCLDHVLLREVIQEEAARSEAALGKTAKGKAASGPTDAEVVMQAEHGVPGAFDILVERYFNQIAGAAYAQLQDREEAWDVAQDAFHEAAKKLSTLRVRDKFGHWVYGIARRKAIYILRRRKMHRTAIQYKKDEEKTLPGQDEPDAPINRDERNAQIRASLNRLPEIYREILVLKYIDGRSYDEIAKLLGVSLAAVDKRLMRGKDMLRESLRRWMGEGGG